MPKTDPIREAHLAAARAHDRASRSDRLSQAAWEHSLPLGMAPEPGETHRDFARAHREIARERVAPARQRRDRRTLDACREHARLARNSAAYTRSTAAAARTASDPADTERTARLVSMARRSDALLERLERHLAAVEAGSPYPGRTTWSTRIWGISRAVRAWASAAAWEVGDRVPVSSGVLRGDRAQRR